MDEGRVRAFVKAAPLACLTGVVLLANACATSPPRALPTGGAPVPPAPPSSTSPRPPPPPPKAVEFDAARPAALRSVLDLQAPRLDPPARAAVARAVAKAERRTGIDAVLLLALIAQESRFDPQARGPAGGLGLMQVREATGHLVARRLGLAWKGRATLLDPIRNVRIGTAYLAQLVHRFNGDLELGLTAYNIGPTRLARMLARGRRPRLRFARRVLDHYAELQRVVAAAQPAVPAGL